MKKVKLVFILVLTCFLFILTGFTNVKVKATTPEVTSDKVFVEGAQIRTTSPMALRFVGKSDTTFTSENLSVKKYGILLGYGAAFIEEMVKGGTTNGKKILSGECDNLTEDGRYYINLINIPEDSYASVFTARAYVILTDDQIIYSDTAVIRSLAQVALRAKDDNKSNETIDAIVTSFDNNYLVLNPVNYKGNIEISASLYEKNYNLLRERFINDWNKVFNTTFTSFTADEFFNEAKGEDFNLSNSRLYQFFNNEIMKPRWGFLIEYFRDHDGTIHGEREAVAVLGDGTNGDYKLFKGDHLIYSIYNFFNASHEVGGFTANSFTNLSKYKEACKNCNILIDLQNYQPIQVGVTLNLPTPMVPNGYSFDGYLLNGEPYKENTYVVENRNVEIEIPINPIEYTISFYKGEEKLTSNINSYNITKEVTLEPIDIEGYLFKGWYDNKELTGEAVTTIPKGSMENKVFYGKYEKTANPLVTLNYNGGSTVYNTRADMVDDFMKDYNAFAGTSFTDPIELYKHNSLTSFWKNEANRAKWLWIWEEMLSYRDIEGKKINEQYIRNLIAGTGYSGYAFQNLPMYLLEINYDIWKTDYEPTLGKLPSYVTVNDYTKSTPNKFRLYQQVQTETVENTDGLLPTLIKEGYTFDGWYSTSTFEEGTKVETVTKDITLYAKFTKVTP